MKFLYSLKPPWRQWGDTQRTVCLFFCVLKNCEVKLLPVDCELLRKTYWTGESSWHLVAHLCSSSSLCPLHLTVVDIFWAVCLGGPGWKVNELPDKLKCEHLVNSCTLFSISCSAHCFRLIVCLILKKGLEHTIGQFKAKV